MATKKHNMAVTIILTCHYEGLVAYRVLRAWQRIRAHATANHIHTTLLVVLDSANAETFQAIVDHQHELGIDRILTTAHGDAGLARNDAINHVATPYVVIADADDLPSENWVTAGMQTVTRCAHPAVIHPELMVFFGKKRHWYRLPNQHSAQCDVRQLVHYHYWSSSILTRTEHLRSYPYQPSAVGSGWGHEDWEWNTRVIAHGIVHYVAPHTLRAYRSKTADSLCDQHTEMGDISRPNAFFENPTKYTPTTTYAPSIYQVPPKKLQRMARRIRKPQPTPLPDWAVAELHNLARIEPALYPVHQSLWPNWDNRAPSPWPGEAYQKLLDQWPASARITHAILMPWLQTGGADKTALAHIHTLAAVPTNRVAVITTQKAPNTWGDQLPKSVLHIHFDDIASFMPPPWQMSVLTRLLLQRAPKIVHLINARLGWEVLKNHGTALTQHSTWYTTVFCDDYTPDGAMHGYVQEFLADCWPHLTNLFTDSEYYRQSLLQRFGLPKDFVRTQYALAPDPRARTARPSTTFLWAGRVDYQKRPDILLAIARALPHVNFDVYGSAVLQSETDYMRALRRAHNIHVHGSFTDFMQLPHTKYAGFIYTSQWDGLPNVLLEATAAGLPIVAPNEGGVPELITKPTGYLVNRFDNVAEYVSAIQHILAHPAYAEEKVTRAQQLLTQRHSNAHWQAQLESIPNYVHPNDAS